MKNRYKKNNRDALILTAWDLNKNQKIQSVKSMVSYLIDDLKSLSPGSVVIAEILLCSINEQAKFYINNHRI